MAPASWWTGVEQSVLTSAAYDPCLGAWPVAQGSPGGGKGAAPDSLGLSLLIFSGLDCFQTWGFNDNC